MNTVSSISLNRFPQRGKKVRKKESSICSIMAKSKTSQHQWILWLEKNYARSIGYWYWLI